MMANPESGRGREVVPEEERQDLLLFYSKNSHLSRLETRTHQSQADLDRVSGCLCKRERDRATDRKRQMDASLWDPIGNQNIKQCHKTFLIFGILNCNL